MEAKAGDVLMFSGPIQHCAMPNKSDHVRCAVDIIYTIYRFRYYLSNLPFILELNCLYYLPPICRLGILQHMVPTFVTPFEKISGDGEL